MVWKWVRGKWNPIKYCIWDISATRVQKWTEQNPRVIKQKDFCLSNFIYAIGTLDTESLLPYFWMLVTYQITSMKIKIYITSSMSFNKHDKILWKFLSN